MGRRGKKNKKQVTEPPPETAAAAAAAADTGAGGGAGSAAEASPEKRKSGFGFGLFGFGGKSASDGPTEGSPVPQLRDEVNPVAAADEEQRKPVSGAADEAGPRMDTEESAGEGEEGGGDEFASPVGSAGEEEEEEQEQEGADENEENEEEAGEKGEVGGTPVPESVIDGPPVRVEARAVSSASVAEQAARLEEKEALWNESLTTYMVGGDEQGKERSSLLPVVGGKCCVAFAAARAGLRVVETRIFLPGKAPRGASEKQSRTPEPDLLLSFQLEKESSPGEMVLVHYTAQASGISIDGVYAPQLVNSNGKGAKSEASAQEGKEVLWASVPEPDGSKNANHLIRWLEDAARRVRVQTFGLFVVGNAYQQGDQKKWDPSSKKLITCSASSDGQS